MADTPNDLAIVPQTSTDKNYFSVKVVGLKIDQSYSFQFQWILDDGTLSDWSPGYQIATPTEVVPTAPSVVVPATSTGSIPVTLSTFPTNAKRVDIYVIGGEFGAGKVADYFLSAGTKNIAVAGGVYQVSLITVTPSNINGNPTNTFTITVATAGEVIQAPTNPNGFSIDRVLSGIQVNWAGTYANGTFTGFEAIKIYVGNSASFTNGTYREAGVMTGNNVKNTITIPVDGTYLRYDLPVYVHAAAINKSGTLGTVQVNVANSSLGARSAIGSDLADLIITNTKLVDDAVSAAKILTGAITTTKIADDAITSPKIIANAITADKITTGAIIADKIATNAITAGKILAGTIDVSKLSAGTISVNNLEAGNINATSFIRAGSGNTGARVEISSAAISGGPAAGFYIYNSAGTAILSAPLSGGLSIVGGGSFTGDISGASGTFAGNLSASNGLFSVSNGILTALSGTIGGWKINSTQLRSNGANQISLNQGTPKIALITGATLNGATGLYEGGTEVITIDPVSGIVGPTVTVAGNSGPGFSLSPNGTAVIRGTIYASAGIFSGNVTGATITTSRLTSPQGTFSIDTYSSYDQIRWSVGGAVSTLGYTGSGMNWDGPGNNGFQMTTAGNTVINSWGNRISLSAGTQQSVTYVSGGAVGQNTFIVNSVASLSVGKYLVSGAGQVGSPYLGAPNIITAINAGTNQITMTDNFTSQASGVYVFKGPTTKDSGGLANLYSSNSPFSLGLRNSVAMSSADATSYGISNGATVNQNYYAFYNGDVVFSY